jgi:hypothetical protein
LAGGVRERGLAPRRRPLTNQGWNKGCIMSLIVAARFTTFPAAESAAERLFRAGFLQEDVSLFFVNPRGQHARFPIGGDENKDAAATDTPKGAAMA